jgi:hypothetical protein
MIYELKWSQNCHQFFTKRVGGSFEDPLSMLADRIDYISIFFRCGRITIPWKVVGYVQMVGLLGS